MNKEQFTTILKSCMFAFDGATQQEILQLNSDYEPQMVLIGIKLLAFLQEKVK